MGKGITEREINLWDMLWAVCLKWRSILACAVVFTILAGGFSYYKNLKNVSVQQQEKRSEDVAEQLSTNEKNLADVYLKYAEVYNNQENYNKKALLMNLDANNFYKGEVTYYIDNHYEVEYPIMAKNNNIVAMVNSYKAALNKEEFAEKLEDVISIEDADIYGMELIDCENTYGGTGSIESDAERGVFTISMYADSEELCNKLKEIVKEELQSYRDYVAQQMGNHEVTMIQDSCRVAADVKLLEYQEDNADKLQIVSTHMNNIANKFTDLQKTYVSLAEKETVHGVAEKEILQSKDSSPSISKKMLVLGFLAGAIIAFAMWALFYLLNGKIRLEDDFEEIYRTKLLGNIPVENSQKRKWFGFIDCIIIRLRHFNQRYFEQEKAYEMVAANIRIALKNIEKKTILISGAVCGEDEKKVVKELAGRLKQDNIKLEYTSQILYNAEALEKMVEIGQVIFVEKAEQSLYQELQKEIEICNQQRVNLLGCIVVY